MLKIPKNPGYATLVLYIGIFGIKKAFVKSRWLS